MKNKLKTKDIITVILLSLCNILIFSLGTFMYATPITILLTPVLYALLQGVAFYVIGVKVRKPNAYLIYSIIQGVIGFYIPYILLYVVSGLIGELILKIKGYGNLKAIGFFYVLQQVFVSIGSTIYPLAIAFKQTTSKISEQEMLSKVIKVKELLSSWGAPLMLLLVIMAASIGAYIGKKIIKKHILTKEMEGGS